MGEKLMSADEISLIVHLKRILIEFIRLIINTRESLCTYIIVLKYASQNPLMKNDVGTT